MAINSAEILDSGLFKWPEYVVFALVLGISIGIGIFFGCFGSKNATTAEYLLGNRKMHPFPVALSLLTSYVSSITLLGHPIEIYLYGTQFMVSLLCYIPLTLSLIYFYVPFYFNLKVTSIYEYLEMRFNRFTRTYLSFINVVYAIFYMALVVYGPAVALSQVTGINHHSLVAVMFIVCIFYSSIGGIKAVLWTDSVQAFIMFTSVTAVVILGIFNVGGLDVVWERARSSGRITFFNMDPDPRTRHTFWTALIGGYFSWLPMYLNQAQVQRYIALTINLVGLWVLMGMCYLGGLVIYATYYNCDPISNHDVKTLDQILPKFVMDTLGGTPGLPGLFIAGITCAALSTVSSVVNSLAATIVEDNIKKVMPKLTERQLTVATKIISVVTGLLAFGFVFVAELLGNIFSAAVTLLGILGGPTLGIFISGQFFPWTTTWGANAGAASSFVFMSVLGFGSRYYKNELPNQILRLDTSGCIQEPFLNSFSNSTGQQWKEKEYTALITFLSISDLWYPALGCVLTVILAVLFSFILSQFSSKLQPLDRRLLISPSLKFWELLFPSEMRRLILDDRLHFAKDTAFAEPTRC